MSAVDLAMEGLLNERKLWPRWANQSCYFAFNLADWAILSGEHHVVRAISQNIEEFQSSQDWYNRDSDLDTILNLRQAWNSIALGQKPKATELLQSLDWWSFESMETNPLTVVPQCKVGAQHRTDGSLQGEHGTSCIRHPVHGLRRRILGLVEQH